MRRNITVPSGLPGAAPAGDGPDLSALRAAANAIAEHPTRLGLDGFDLDGGEPIGVTVADDVVSTSRLYALLLQDPPSWATGLGPAGARLTGLLARHENLQAVREAAEQADADLGDSDRWAGLEEQAMQEELRDVLGQLLAGQLGAMSEGDRELLRHDASEVLGLDELERQRRLAAQQQAREARTAHQAALNEADEQEQLAQVMLALKHDRPVDDATLDQALSTFAAMSR